MAARRLTRNWRVGRGFGGGRRLLSASVGGESAPEAFAKSKTGAFSQSPPALCNPFTGDPLLQAYLARVLPAEVMGYVLVRHTNWFRKLVKLVFLKHSSVPMAGYQTGFIVQFEELDGMHECAGNDCEFCFGELRAPLS